MHLFYRNRLDWKDTHEIPDDFISLNWTERAYDFGQFELAVFTTDSVPMYRLGNFISRDDTDTVMVIETCAIEQQNNGSYKHTYSGRSLESIYTWRVLEHKTFIKPDAQQKFNAQLFAQQMANNHLGAAAGASRALPGWTFHTDPEVSEYAYVNDTGQKLQDGKWVVWDRCPLNEPFGQILQACKPNGYPLYYKVTWEQGNFHTYVRHPRLVETIVLSDKNENFTDFKAVYSILDSKNVVFEVFDSGDVELNENWIADGTTHRREHRLRYGDGVDRREALWNNTQVHKPYRAEDWKALTPAQKQMVSALTEMWYPYWVLDAMFPKYNPLGVMSGKIDNFSNVEYRKGFVCGDVMYYVPTNGAQPIEAQLTEMTESWSDSGFTQTPAISMASRNKWTGDTFRLNYLRKGPGIVIEPRDGDFANASI